jgi:hypothetical protein
VNISGGDDDPSLGRRFDMISDEINVVFLSIKKIASQADDSETHLNSVMDSIAFYLKENSKVNTEMLQG